MADAALRGASLVEVLPAAAGRSRAFYLLYPHNRHVSARVRAFVDYLSGAVQSLVPPPSQVMQRLR